ncbi:MAG: DUF2357 domain-containing protein [Bacilli bacterium]
MNENLIKILKATEENKLNDFSVATVSSVNNSKSIKKVYVDLSWLKTIEETLPCIDNIIRNPRRFLKEEEEVVIVEKTKKVTEATVKHLATHSSLIQSINEKGEVLPKKLLNVYKEETFSIYENRFIYSLIKNLYNFVAAQVFIDEYKSYSKEENIINYKGETSVNGDDVSLRMQFERKHEKDDNKSKEEVKDIKERLNKILSEVDGFLRSSFMKNLVNVSPVKSPINRTNAIRKDNNLKQCLVLWEKLEEYQLTEPVKKEEEVTHDVSNKLKKDMEYLYYLNYNFLALDKEDNDKNYNEELILHKIIMEYVKNNDVSINKFKSFVLKEFKEAFKDKEDLKKRLKKCYNEYFDDINKCKNKAVSFLS